MKDLLALEPVKQFIVATGEGILKYFGKDNACIIYLQPDGVFYGMGLYQWLSKKKKNLTITTMKDDGEGLEEDKVRKRKILLVDNDVITGKGYKRSIEALRLMKQRLGIKDVKFAVYSDRLGLADFSVGKYSSEAVWRLDIMDALDMKIIKYLSENGRISFAEIGKKVNLSAVSVANRVDKLVKEKIFSIHGGLIINQFYTMSAHLQIEAESKTIQKLIDNLEKEPEVYHLVKVSGKQILELGILIRNLSNVEQFIENKVSILNGIKKIDVYIGELPVLPKSFRPF